MKESGAEWGPQLSMLTVALAIILSNTEMKKVKKHQLRKTAQIKDEHQEEQLNNNGIKFEKEATYVILHWFIFF